MHSEHALIVLSSWKVSEFYADFLKCFLNREKFSDNVFNILLSVYIINKEFDSGLIDFFLPCWIKTVSKLAKTMISANYFLILLQTSTRKSFFIAMYTTKFAVNAPSSLEKLQELNMENIQNQIKLEAIFCTINQSFILFMAFSY